jgi:D-threo-aldose 1-dehydrogenase
VCADLIARCDLDCLLLAGRYTLLEQPALRNLFPACRQLGISVVIGGPFNSGILATESVRSGAPYNYEPAPASIMGRASRIAGICREIGVPMPAAALQFPLAHPQVASVVAGCSSADEVQRVVEWMQIRIPSGLWQALRDDGLLDADAPVPA